MATTRRRQAQKQGLPYTPPPPKPKEAPKKDLRSFCEGVEGVDHQLDILMYRTKGFESKRDDGSLFVYEPHEVRRCSLCGRVVIVEYDEEDPDSA